MHTGRWGLSRFIQRPEGRLFQLFGRDAGPVLFYLIFLAWCFVAGKVCRFF